jgi:DNA-binding XRE family transcriptional regulator
LILNQLLCNIIISYTFCDDGRRGIMRFWLLEKRKNKEKTQDYIAYKARISRSMYAMIESGERNPSVPVAKNIARVLNFDWTLFFEE